MSHDELEPREVLLDAGEVGGEPARLAGTYFPAAAVEGVPLLVCLPGGTYTRGYFDLDVPGRPGYSFARDATARGFPVVALDHLGTGASTRPGRDIGLADQAAAVAAALESLRPAVGHAGPAIAVGHSMGGYVAMLQQAALRSYDALAILGTTNQQVAPLGLPPEMIDAAASEAGRAALVEQLVAAIPDLYVTGDRAPMRDWFHHGDVPDDVIAVDDATTLTVVPRRCAGESTVPGIAAEAAAAVDVPVLLAYGDPDVSPRPHAEPAFFSRSPDVTLVVLAGSGHCHNMSAARRRLWDRLAGWIGAVTG